MSVRKQAMSRKNLRVQVTGLFAPLVNDFFLFRLLFIISGPTTFIFVFKYIQYGVLKRIADSLKSTFWYRQTLRYLKKKECLQGFSPSRWLDARPVSNFILVRVARAFGSPSCASHLPLYFICYCVAFWSSFRVVLCNSFPAMLLNRFMCCLFFLLTISAIDVNSYSSIKQYRDALIARLLLKSWRKKAEEQRVRFFDRLPQSVESRYTPVNSTSPTIAWYYLNIILSSFIFGFWFKQTQVISYRGYPSEIHHVTTDDG